MKKILLTGANGFIGRNLAEYLQSSYIVLSPRSFELNLSDRNAVKQYIKHHLVDYVIHCAAQGGVRGITDPATIEDINVLMFENLLDSKGNNIPMLVFGSGAQYDRKRELRNIRERELGIYIPTEPYGRAKMRIAMRALERDDLLCLTIFGCYGRYERKNRFPSYVLSCSMKNIPMECNQDMLFDYLFIDDLCSIVCHFLNHYSRHRVLNVTPSQSVYLHEVAETANIISGRATPIYFTQPGLNYAYTGDNTNLLEELGNFTFTPLTKGLIKLKSALCGMTGMNAHN